MAGSRTTWVEAATGAACLLLLLSVGAARAMEERLAAEEASAVATLRTLASCEAQAQTAAKVDTDGDGTGEYATLLELGGSVGVRRALRAGKGKPSEPGYVPLSSTFETVGKPLKPPILPSDLRAVDGTGFVRKGGYAFVLFLPDASVPASFVREKGPAGDAGLSGGSGTIGVDLSESLWCAYAQPLRRGETGTRRFFVNQSWEVLQSGNAVARAEGADPAFRADAAFRGAGITSEVAVGTVGRDGDAWTYAE